MKKTVISIAFLSIAVIFACRKDFSPDVGDSDKDTFLSQSKSYYYQQALKLGGWR